MPRRKGRMVSGHGSPKLRWTRFPVPGPSPATVLPSFQRRRCHGSDSWRPRPSIAHHKRASEHFAVSNHTNRTFPFPLPLPSPPKSGRISLFRHTGDRQLLFGQSTSDAVPQATGTYLAVVANGIGREGTHRAAGQGCIDQSGTPLPLLATASTVPKTNRASRRGCLPPSRTARTSLTGKY
jgi:hypothetical protein